MLYDAGTAGTAADAGMSGENSISNRYGVIMAEKIGNRRWFIMVLFFMCYTVLYMDRACMSMAGPSMIEYYGWTRTQFGYASTAFFLGYASTMILGGTLADKFGGGKVVCVASMWWSVFVFLTPIPAGSSLILMIFIRAMMGVGEGVALPAMTSMIAKWIPKKESGLAQGMTLVGVATGLALTMPLASWIINTWSWQTVFHTFAFLAPVWVLIWWKFGAERPEKDKKITEAELEYIRQVPAGSANTNEADLALTPGQAFSTRAVWIGAASFFCTNYLFYLFMTWLPTYFVQGRSLTLSGSALSSMMPYVLAMFTYPLGGWLADKCAIKYGHNLGRKIFPWVGQLAAGILLYFATQAETVFAATALVSLSNGFLCLTMGGYYSMPIIFSKKHAGKIVGLWGTFATFGGIFAPTVTGILVDSQGYNFALIAGACVAVVGAVLLTFVQIKPIADRYAK